MIYSNVLKGTQELSYKTLSNSKINFSFKMQIEEEDFFGKINEAEGGCV